MAEVSQADFDYFNGSIKKIGTDSSVLVSSSPYLNNARLRDLIAQEMLRRNGADVPNTAFIPEVAQILHQLEDHATIFRLIEEEKLRLEKEIKRFDKKIRDTQSRLQGIDPSKEFRNESPHNSAALGRREREVAMEGGLMTSFYSTNSAGHPDEGTPEYTANRGGTATALPMTPIRGHP